MSEITEIIAEEPVSVEEPAAEEETEPIVVNPYDPQGRKLPEDELKKLLPRQKQRHHTRYLYCCEMCDLRTTSYKIFQYHMLKKKPCVEIVSGSDYFRKQLKSFTIKYEEFLKFMKVQDIPMSVRVKEYQTIKYHSRHIYNMSKKLSPEFPQDIIAAVHKCHEEVMKFQVFGETTE